MIEAYFHPVNQNLSPPDLDQVIWRLMRFEHFKSLIKHRALWFARFDEMEDKEECRIPEKNLRPSIDALISAGIPVHVAHAAGLPEAAGKAFWSKIAKEKPLNLINCWFLGEEPSDEMWREYGKEPGSVAIKSRGIDVGEALSRAGGNECFANPVMYVDHDKDELPMEHFLGPFFAKRRQFGFERELRYLMHLPKQAPAGAYVPVDLKRMIRELRVNRAAGFDPGVLKDLLDSVGIAVDVIDVSVRGHSGAPQAEG